MKQTSGRGSVMKRIKGKRDWVKNAIIIFLAVMLVLTFFSNSIMNYSLPEVAAQYPQSTTITTKIRGSGTVEAAQTYNVTIQETRTVAAVNVKVGDSVKAGDTLLTLDAAESQELTDARKNYEALKLEYEKMLLNKGDQSHAAAQQLQQLRDAVSKAESDLAKARNFENELTWYEDQVSNAQSVLSNKNQEKAEIDRQLMLLQNEKDSIATSNQDYLAADRQCREAQTALDEVAGREPPFSEETADSSEPVESEAHRAWQKEWDAASETLAQKQRARDQLLSDLTLDVDQRISSKTAEQINAGTAISDAQTSLEAANNALAKFQNESTVTSVDAAEEALRAARSSLAAAEASAKDTEAEQTYNDEIAKMDLDAKAKDVKEAEEKVKKLEEKSAAAKIVSRYAGVVQSVNIAAGDTTSAETPLMVVELTEKGYTLTATVTKEQAKMLREGLSAEITNLWDSGITMTLGAITADKSNPASSRTLTFAVQGENVTVGQQLNFSIGDKNASYDVVVPSSAVHADADGSFVYTIVAKASPLGNRYTVKKTAVEVLASDETSSAVTGELSTADFVITTATVPLQPGDQVRIAE